MDDPTILGIHVVLLVTGLAGSLHCIGMCGPILIGFSQVFERTRVTVAGQAVDADTRPGPGARGRAAALVWDFVGYHVGRIWTYALLGFAAGWSGEAIRHGSALAGWHRVAGIALGIVVVISGVLLAGVNSRLRLDALLNGCALERWRSWGWFRALLHGQGLTPRLLLGVVMGFLPCGLVYAMLAMVAILPTPWHAALGMIVFGIGTLPSLTVALTVGHLVPARWRAHGTRLAAVMLIVTGAWMTIRSALPHEHGDNDGDMPAPHQMTPDHGADMRGH